MIKYLKHSEIDLNKWDLCIEQSTNSLPYAFSWYLHMVAPQWDALVAGDYEAVMPLTWNKKLGIRYLYQPFFTQQLGVFYRSDYYKESTPDFIKAIPSSFKFIDIHLNAYNHFEHTDIKLKKRKNFVLDISKPYEKLFKGYDQHCTRNIKKARKFNHVIRPVEPVDVINFYRKHKGLETKNVGHDDYRMLEKLSGVAREKKVMITYGVFNDNQEMLAAGIFLYIKGRVIYLLGTASPKGKEARAMYALIDYAIMQSCGHPVVFDFEGSEIPGIARFFRGFGAEKQPFYKLKINRLPLLIRWLK